MRNTAVPGGELGPPYDRSEIKVMGVLNVTPDSFSDGGVFLRKEAALIHAQNMCDAGAAIIDVGGESTRPGASGISAAQELDRVIPVIKAIHSELPALISIDTMKPEVMREAVAAGAGMINDINALRAEGALAAVLELKVPVCLMHMRGQPRTMQNSPQYVDVVAEVRTFLLERIRVCEQAGVNPSMLLIDPGFGFGKTLEHNLQLLAHLEAIVAIGLPVVAGLSRKSMLGTILDKPTNERLYGSMAAAVIAAAKGAQILRVHDVAATVDALKVVAAVRQATIQ